MDKIKEQMLKDFGLNKSDVVESKRQKAHKELVNDPNKLGHFITIRMNAMIQKGKVPSWDNYCCTAEWAVMAMNLSEEGKFKFGNKWREIYQELTGANTKKETKNEPSGEQ